MVKGSIIFNCLQSNDNLREFSRGDCFIQAVEHIAALSDMPAGQIRIRLTYSAVPSSATVHADIWVDGHKLHEEIQRGLKLRADELEGPT